MPMSYLPSGQKMRIPPFIEASPSAIVDLVQTPVLLYLWIVLPVLFLAYVALILLYIFTLPFTRSRRRMRSFLGKFSAQNIAVRIHSMETKILRTNWGACLYIIALGSPFVAILSVIYGHHFISISAYDSPFQSFAEIYGFLFLLLPAVFFAPFSPSIPVLALGVLVITFTGVFFVALLWIYSIILLKGINRVLRWHMLSIGVFTVVQPFIFRFLRYTLLPLSGFSQTVPPFYGLNSTYVAAFLLPCCLYACAGILLHRRFQKNLPPWFIGLHGGLLYLAVLAADLH